VAPEALRIRALGPDEIGLIAGVDPRFADPARRRYAGELLAAGLSWLALVDETPAGFAIVTGHFYAYPFVDLLYVAETCRRRGVGAALMTHCERAHHADRIFTSTNESNAPMRALLAGLGWAPSGQIDNLDPGDPELVFVKLRAPA
jgi:GNAT superfamily N-acetyltransferase